MLGFHAEYQSGDIVLQEDEIAEADWFSCTDLPLIPGKFAISRWLIDEYLSQRGIAV
jgi:NAD+ diphosphatase